MRSLRRIALLITATLVLGACDPGFYLGDILDTAELSRTLSDSSDPAERAAGETQTEVETIREAEESLERGVAERDVTPIRAAASLRPDDPRYPIYEVALLPSTPENYRVRRDTMNRATELIAAQHPEAQGLERNRIGMEMYLDALRDIIRSATEFDDREQKVKDYCRGITDAYPSAYTEVSPQEVALYLTLSADFSLCP